MRVRRFATIGLILICAAGLAVTLFGTYRSFNYEHGILEPLKQDLIRRTEQAAGRLGEPHVEHVAGADVVRWPFEVSQRVHFENSKYPLMRERFALRLAPRELSRTVVLVPDLEAYPILSPAARPGLDDNVYLPGWQVTRTFFELRERMPTTNFGLGASASKEHFPSAYFFIVMYFAILWVAVNSILFVRWPESRFIQYDKNLLPKVLFWPVTLGALWLMTIRTFY